MEVIEVIFPFVSVLFVWLSLFSWFRLRELKKYEKDLEERHATLEEIYDCLSDYQKSLEKFRIEQCQIISEKHQEIANYEKLLNDRDSGKVIPVKVYDSSPYRRN